MNTLEKVINKALSHQKLSFAEIIFLLNLQDSTELDMLFEAARRARQEYFQRKIFLYGFLYFSTWCRNNCTFCYFRRANQKSQRYRKSNAETVEAACQLAESGVHLIDLTLGEDPLFYYQENGFEKLSALVKLVKQKTGFPIMVSPGVVPGDALTLFQAAGADWFACYQETHNPELFSRLRLDQSYSARMESKRLAQRAGLLVEEGIMVGIGESIADITSSVQNMEDLGAQQIRVMSFVPQAGTPLAACSMPSRIRELVVIAVFRLLFPDRLIPASLDIDGVEGLQARLNAGANVITSLIPPQLGLAGVAQSCKDINEGYRTVQGVLPILDQMGLRAASLEEYQSFITAEKEKLRKRQIKAG
ncbi:methylornithine synthase PylB [Candidatus Formimonas warabiya]|uniref:Methylornithine synthase PylB n=1 Tax=Formimonas warabiya TaxID=1761012 RepID=A0A3G1L031_FORW1|nr:methylornithine synthase PylB [Candidatus Formimonas warabiya]ATW28142.1 methylornithine synthase PylB [Candidatus Formimonas warabiya]